MGAASWLRAAGALAVLAFSVSLHGRCAADASQPAISIGDARVVEGDIGVVHLRFPVIATGPVCGPITTDWTTLNGTAAVGTGDYDGGSGTLALRQVEPRFLAGFGAEASFVASMAIAPNGDLYALDKLGGKVLRYHSDGTLVASWGSLGTDPGQFTDPLAIAVDAANQVYVADPHGLRVQKFDADGNLLDSLIAGAHRMPLSVAVDPAGNIYVGTLGGETYKYDSTDTFLYQWNVGNNVLERPMSLAIGTNGKLYAFLTDIDGVQGAVRVFSTTGDPLVDWSSDATAGNLRGIGRLAVDGCGLVYLTDLDRVVVADEDGNFVSEWDHPDLDTGTLDSPVNIAADGAGNAYVSEETAPHVLHFALQRQATIDVKVHGDPFYEGDETISVALSNPSNAALLDSTATGTIVNDDSNAGPNLVANPTFDIALTGWAATGTSVLAMSPDGRNGSGAVMITAPDSILPFGLNDSPDVIASADSAWARYKFSAWVRASQGTGTARLRVREYNGAEFEGATQSISVPLDSTWRLLVVPVLTVFGGSHFDLQVLMDPNEPGDAFLVDDVMAQRLLSDSPPIVSAPDAVSRGWLLPTTFRVNVYDPDGDPIRAWSMDAPGLPGGADAEIRPSSDNNDATFDWTPGLNAIRNASYPVTFTASNARSGSDSTRIRITPNLAQNPSFADDLAGWNGNSGATLARISPGRIDSAAVRITNAAAAATFGITDSPDLSRSVGLGTIYEFRVWVRSPGTGNSSLPVWLQTREYLGGVLVHSESTPHASAYASWQAISTTYYTHLPGSSVDFLVMGSGSGPSNSFDIDDVRITATSIPVLAVPAAPQAALAARVFPNPMRGQGTLSFALPKAGPLAVRVLDVTGRLVRTVSDERSAAAGVHTWKLGHDGTGHRLPAGIYFYRIDSAEGRRSGRFVVLE